MKKHNKIKNDLVKIYKGQNIENKSRKYLILKSFVEYLLITVGTFLMAVAVSMILLPNELSTGGFSGIASIFYYFFNIQAGKVIILLNIPFMIISIFKLGKTFLIKSVYGISVLSFFIDLLENITPITEDRVLACVYGGILSGIGTALVLKGKGSTGGSDLISYIVKAYKPQVRTSKTILIFDAIVVILNIIFFKEIEIGLYSAIAIYIMGNIIDILFEGTNFAKVIFIISEKYKDISKEIGEKINRGSTGLYAKGMYTNEDKMMLICVGSRNEAYDMQNIAKQIDKGAFIVIINAREVLGKGFK